MTLGPDCVLAYKVDGDYAPKCEGGLLWNDPDLAIDWGVDASDAILSDKDLVLPRLKDLAPVSF